jgi:VWFA-related protein
MQRYDRLSLSVLAVTGALLCSIPGPRAMSAAQANGNTRNVFVTLTDKSGQPAKNVAITDFTIREDNQAREVLAVAPATAPMRIALLVDNSQVTQPLTNELRTALTAFIAAIFKASPESTMSVSTFGDRPTLVQDFTNAAPVVARAAQKTFPVTGAGAYLLDAVQDAARRLRKDPAPRQLIVVFVDETGEEFSNVGRQQALDALRLANASMWVVTMQGSAVNTATPEARDRSALIDEGTANTGGTTLSLLNRLALAAKFTDLAAIITGQTQITYGRPDQMIPPKKLDIQLTRKDLKLTAPRWAVQ